MMLAHEIVGAYAQYACADERCGRERNALKHIFLGCGSTYFSYFCNRIEF